MVKYRKNYKRVPRRLGGTTGLGRYSDERFEKITTTYSIDVQSLMAGGLQAQCMFTDGSGPQVANPRVICLKNMTRHTILSNVYSNYEVTGVAVSFSPALFVSTQIASVIAGSSLGISFGESAVDTKSSLEISQMQYFKKASAAGDVVRLYASKNKLMNSSGSTRIVSTGSTFDAPNVMTAYVDVPVAGQ